MSHDPESPALDAAIAIVGMACRLPGALDPDTFWQNLLDGVESIHDLDREALRAGGLDPRLLDHPDYVARGAALEGMARWDHGFFGMSPREAAIMDPQQRHFLEMSWEALERAGYAPGTFDGQVGVFAGSGPNTYMMFNLLGDPTVLREQGFFLVRHIGNDKDFVATRVSYHLNLTGPGVTIQTACSTSLATVHTAIQSLLSYECDMALAGALTISFPHMEGYLYREGEILSPDGHCRAFDADSAGTVLGDGGGVVVLRRYRDALEAGDTILGVIRGSAMNNDGSAKVGYLAPSVEGQSRVVAEALAVADVHPESIGYIEAHGTGTPVGDPIEVTALTRAFRTETERVGYCGLGSVKTNIGHLDTGAGVAGLMKATLAVRHGVIPPSLHFKAPNPELGLDESPFRVVAERTEWVTEDGGPRRAGVNSLGVGGTNVHVIVEEPPVLAGDPDPRTGHLFLLSGRSRRVVERASARLVDHLETHPDDALADVAFTLQAGRNHFKERRFVVARTREEAIDALVTGDEERVEDHAADGTRRSVAFLFAGGGAQYPGMARDLYEAEPLFRGEVDRGLAHLEPELRRRVEGLLELGDAPAIPEAEREKPSLALPALFLVQHAQARLWMSWGVEPSAMIGHSMGEYTAACLAGVFSLEEALELVVLRGALFETVSGGGMLSVPLAEADLRPLLGDELSVAAVNGPELCVASGPREAIAALEQTLAAREIEARRIHIDVAAHSSMLEPILAPFRARFQRARLNPPTLPFASNLTGTWITAAEATDPEYWVRQLRQTVRFSDGLKELLADPGRVLLEVGPGRTLATLARLHPDRDPTQEIFTSLRHPDDQMDDEIFQLQVLGRLWQRGVAVDWTGVHGGVRRRRVPLPTYPFEWEEHLIRPRYRLDAAANPALTPDLGGGDAAGGEPAVEGNLPLPAAAPLPGAAPGAPLVGGTDVAASAGQGPDEAEAWLHRVAWQARALSEDLAAEALENGLLLVVGPETDAAAVAAREALTRRHGSVRQVAPDEELGAVLDEVGMPTGILYLGALPPLDREGAFFRLLALGQELATRLEGDDEVDLVLLTRGAHRVGGEVPGDPLGALVAGPARVFPHELPGVEVLWVDLPAEGSEGPLLQALGRELARDPADEAGASEVALRKGGERFVRGYRPLEDAAAATLPQSSPEALPASPVILLTGGFGGVGLELARHLAAGGGARLVLLGRTPLPPRGDWSELDARGVDPRVRRAVAVVNELEAAGAQVLAMQADVTDEERMRAVRDEVRRHFGEVDVVLHAAGVLDDALIPVTTREAASRVLAPKVDGAQVLERIFRDPAPARFVLFSSVSAEAGLPGQVDYAAANAFLDALARTRDGSEAQGARITSVGWSAWAETGMAVDPARGMEAWPPLVGTPWRDAADSSFDAVDPEGRRARVRMREGRLWMLDEHRTRDGMSLVPGAGFLELVGAALRELGLLDGDRALVLEEVFFLAPFAVPSGETREMEIRVPEDGEFTIVGRGRPDEEWTEHVRGRLEVQPRPEAVSVAGWDGQVPGLGDLEGAGGAGGHATPRQDLALGPRWSNVARMMARSGEGTWDAGLGAPAAAGSSSSGVGTAVEVDEVLLTLELPKAFARDLPGPLMHPALLDNATALAGPLLPGFGEAGSVYVPASYGAFTLHRPLPARFHSRIRRAEGVDEASDELSVLDVTLFDEDGVVLAEARQFVLVRLGAQEMAQEQERRREERDARRQAVAQAAASGMPTRIGMEIVELVLTGQVTGPHLLVASEAVPARLEALREAALGAGARRRAGGGALVDTTPVEAALLEMEAVTEAAVTAHEDRPGEVRLVAHVVMDPSVFATVSELRRGLRTRLDAGLVPQNFVQLEALPRNRKGKVLRSELRDPFAPVDDYVAPETPTQEAIARIWRDLLGAQRIGLHDNFLDVGGHSLLAMRAILRMEKATGVRVGPIQMNMFTLEQIAAHIEDEGGGGATEPAADGTDAHEPTRVPQGEICVGPRPAEASSSGEEAGEAPEGSEGHDRTEDGGGKKGFLSKVRRIIQGP